MLALMYEAKTHDIEILAIGVSYGNTYLENTTKNILKILTVADKKKLVYAGADKPLINKYESDNFFGDDGFGDFNFTQEITAKIDRSKHASVAYVDLVKKYPGEITIISLGSLTTIATAIALEPNFLSLIKQHIIMGASLKPNETEFNFQLDPESDWIALNNVDKPSIIVPIDTVYSYVFSQTAQATGSVPEIITYLATHVKTYNETLLGCILFITSRIYFYSYNGCFANVLSGNQTGGAVATNGVSRPKCSLPLPNTALI
ncbi:Inosine-uridine preferring nucleoside hydrolase [Trachymyrmex septentrionalis]|uniref:Inosine-uridine preferring nucleoside hydrolase n=1 Tax=Trachymyrmex septentrionalis TaxID=34720 RepID=A0A195FB43_9HYME|nr:Inosine-uridine preferring nucleoside hydrolase [Trachymyrmex septentrionalis]